ncbi:YkgJ family cysteine cluster protein [Candidatus Pacearchaeota archaeon]|nr:YkgJ family cysteine cluster protein [Candidatus Pacearchaeota archaeon]
MDKFICHGCAKCCKKFGPKGLPLFEFEKKKAKEIALRKGIAINILPTEVFLDKKSGQRFAVLYGLFQEPCPFLKDNQCSIYDERFMICRQFPVFSTASFRFAKIKGAPEFMECGNFDTAKQFSQFLSKEFKSIPEIEEYLKNTYETCFDVAKKSNEESERIMDKLIALEKEGKIDLKSVDYKSLKKDEKVLGFSEFLKSIPN